MSETCPRCGGPVEDPVLHYCIEASDARAGFIRFREGVSTLLRRLHLPYIQGWWDAGTDQIRRERNAR